MPTQGSPNANESPDETYMSLSIAAMLQQQPELLPIIIAGQVVRGIYSPEGLLTNDTLPSGVEVMHSNGTSSPVALHLAPLSSAEELQVKQPYAYPSPCR